MNLKMEEEFEMSVKQKEILEMDQEFKTGMGQEKKQEMELELELNTHNAVSYHWRVWELMGLMQPPEMPRLQFVVRSAVINVLVTLLFPLTLLAKLFFTSSLKELFENLTITITDFVANLKFINVFLVRRQLREITDILRVLDKRAKIVHNQEELRVLHQSVKTAQSSFRTFAWIFVFGTALSCIRVAIARDRQLLYPAWFGVDWQCSDLAYWLINVYQLFGLIVQAIQDCANDSYPPAYLCILTGHMRALELRVRRIGYPQPLAHTLYNQARYHQSVYVQLCECIEDYINILRLNEIIQEILSIACMAQFVCSAAVQCTVAMHVLYVVDSNDLSTMMLSLVFFMAVTLEVFLICYFGDRMRTQSEALLDAFYACNWMDQMPQFKRNLIITLMRTQKPSFIYAGSYIPVTLETFVQV
ncbi:hypothetical protein ACLKA7_007557 [Drosophila subpalustris]